MSKSKKKMKLQNNSIWTITLWTFWLQKECAKEDKNDQERIAKEKNAGKQNRAAETLRPIEQSVHDGVKSPLSSSKSLIKLIYSKI